MPTLNEYFRTEAQDFLTALERSLQRTPSPDAAELHRSVRGLRGTAQMAREQRIFDVVSAFETVTRSLVGGGLAWSDQFAARARDTIADLRILLDRTEEDEQLDARVNDAAARWSNTDSPSAPAPGLPVVSFDVGTRELREFAAREAAGIADALDNGIHDLQADPMDREPLRTILRRQRALLGSARLDEIPVVADILRAVEDLTHVIARLDVGVKQEWLDIYRVARDALQSTIAPLLRDEAPEPSKAVSRLRHMRAELLERYGAGDEDAGLAERALVEPTLSQPQTPLFAHDSPRGGSTAERTEATPISHPAYGSAPAVADALEVEDGAPQADDDSVLDLSADDELASDDDSLLDLSADDEIALDGDSVLDLSADDELASDDDSVLDLSADDELAPDDDSVLDLSADDEIALDSDSVLDLSADDEVVHEDRSVVEVGEPVDSAVRLPGSDLPGPVEPDPVQDDAVPAADIVEIGALGYTREDALKRALELRELISRAVAHDPQARDAIDELFDLIRIALE